MSELLIKRQMGSFMTTPLGLGTARLGAFWQGKKIADGVTAVRSAVDQGIGLIDTADVYARGLSERIVGKAVGGREGVVIMTKVGLLKTPIGLARAAKATGKRPGPSGLRRAAAAATCFESSYIEASARDSLKRLGRDTLDVYLLHEPTVEDFAAGHFLDAMSNLTERGLVHQWGASVRTKEAALAAMDTPGLSWLQVPANVSNVEIAAAVAQHERATEVTVLGLGVLGDGSLLSPDALAGRSRLEVVPQLVHDAATLPGLDGVLLGMSTPEHVTANLAALAQYELRRAAQEEGNHAG